MEKIDIVIDEIKRRLNNLEKCNTDNPLIKQDIGCYKSLLTFINSL